MANKPYTEQYPLHVVCAWIGNTQPVAAKHYLQVTDAHFDHPTRCKTRRSCRRPLRNAQHCRSTVNWVAI